MSLKEAFIATYYYLLGHYNRTQDPNDGSSLEIGDLLSDMVFLEDGDTADSAAWHDWLIAVKQAQEEKGPINLETIDS